jgi:hypothetical protein
MPAPVDDCLAPLVAKGFDFQWLSHAEAIFKNDFPLPLRELVGALGGLTLPITEIIGSGGGETKFTQRLRRSLAASGWPKHTFVISKVVDGVPKESTSHEVDHVRRTANGVVACEIEWNNKDPFFDRDLENFKRLHVEGAISAGVLITRGSSLQEALHQAVTQFTRDRGIKSLMDLKFHGVEPTRKQVTAIENRVLRARSRTTFSEAWVSNFMSNKYGAATTHWSKLQDRVRRGVANPCPMLLIGLPAGILVHDKANVEELSEAGGLFMDSNEKAI